MRTRPWIIALLASCGATAADDLQAVPRYPVDRICADRFATSPAGRAGCVQTEQGRYDVLLAIWSSVPPADRARCAATAGRQPMWNYVYLFSCADQALQRASIRNPEPFHY